LRTTSSQASRSSGVEVRHRAELAGIDDAHVHARLDGVVQEDGVHRLAHGLIAAEGKGQVGDTAGDMACGSVSRMVRVASMKSTP
jgi:hypothetical protein